MKQVVTKRLETERLYLDKGTIEDYLKVREYDFLKLRDIDGEFKYEKQNLQEIKDWFIDGIEKFHQNNEKANVFEWIIYLKNNQPIGNIFTHTNKKDNNENSTEIAYNLHPKYWGK